MKIVIFGAGYVGGVTGAVLAYVGHDVTLVDPNQDKVRAINEGRAPMHEPGLDPILDRAVADGRLRALTETPCLTAVDVIFIAVGTPPLPSGAPDLSQMEAAALAIGANLDLSGHQVIIVNKATVPIGTTHLVSVWVSAGSLDQAVEGTHFAVASNPEFLREGSAVFDTLYPDRIVLGTDSASVRDQLVRVFDPIINGSFICPAGVPQPHVGRSERVPVVSVDPVSSEMIKYAANAFLSMKISFANELATICELVGGDITRVTGGIGLDGRIGVRFLQAGVGWGGSCFSKDLSSLVYTAREYGYEPLLLQAIQKVNDGQRQKVVQHVLDLLRPVKGRKVAIWGLAYKPDTDDVRDAPAYTIMRELVKLGIRVSAYDPVASVNFQSAYSDIPAQYVDQGLLALRGADALVILTEWPEFRQVALADVARELQCPVLIDGRNMFDPESAREAGLIYRGIGRPTATLMPVLQP